MPRVLFALWLSLAVAVRFSNESANPMRILPLGASVTYGQGSSDGNGYRLPLLNLLNPTTDVDYVGSVRSGNMTDNQNEGHPGYRIDYIGGQARKGTPDRPNVILLHAGLNDIVQNYNVTYAPSRLGALVDQLVSACPDAAIMVSNLFTIGNATILERIKAFNAAVPDVIRQRASNGVHVLLVDMYSRVQLSDLGPDQQHPKDSGYQVMAQAWYESLQQARSSGWIGAPLELPQSSTVASSTQTSAYASATRGSSIISSSPPTSSISSSSSITASRSSTSSSSVRSSSLPTSSILISSSITASRSSTGTSKPQSTTSTPRLSSSASSTSRSSSITRTSTSSHISTISTPRLSSTAPSTSRSSSIPTRTSTSSHRSTTSTLSHRSTTSTSSHRSTTSTRTSTSKTSQTSTTKKTTTASQSKTSTRKSSTTAVTSTTTKPKPTSSSKSLTSSSRTRRTRAKRRTRTGTRTRARDRPTARPVRPTPGPSAEQTARAARPTARPVRPTKTLTLTRQSVSTDR